MNSPAVLIIDDDPSHLRIYGWIIHAAGFLSVPALVTRDKVQLPEARSVDLVLLDYHIHGPMTAPEVAAEVKRRFGAPIIVLSDALMLPDDIAPLVDGFVRKGDPARLVDAVRRALHGNRGAPARLVAE